MDLDAIAINLLENDWAGKNDSFSCILFGVLRFFQR